LGLITDAAKQVFTILTTGDFSAGPLAQGGPIVTALQDINDGFDTLAKTAGDTFDAVKKKAEEFGAALSSAISSNITVDVSAILPALVSQFETFGAPIVEAFKKGIETGDFSSLGSPIGKAIAAILDSLVVGADGLFNVLKDLIGSVNWGELALELGKQVPTLLLGLVTGILSFDMGSFFGFIADNWFLVLMGVLSIAFMPAKFIGKIAEILAKIPIIGKLLGWLLNTFKSLIDPVMGFIGRMFSRFTQGFMSAGPGLVGTFGTILKNMILRIVDFVVDAVRFFRELPGKFEGVLGQGMVKLGEFMRGAFMKIWDLVKSVTLTGLAAIVGVFLLFAQKILDTAASAFGWIPGIGDKLTTAAEGFRTFRDDVNKSLTGIEDEDVKVNVDTTGKVTYPEGFSALGQKVLGGTLTRAGGGAVFGPGSGTSDSINARLSNGEFVVKADSVRKLGLGNLNEINQTGQLPGYAVGGIFSEKALNTGSSTRADVGTVRDNTVTSVVAASAALFKDIAARALAAGAGPSAAPGSGVLSGAGYQAAFATVLKAFPQANLNSGFRPGDPGYHGQGQAVDLGQVGRAGGAGHPYLAAMNRWIHDSFPNSRELIYDGIGDDRPDLKNGRPLNYGAATSAEHRNHVHWVPPGFKSGGLFDPKLYDNGGILESGHTGVNRSGRPEAVLDPEETRMFKTLVANGGASGPLIGSLTIAAEPGASTRDQLTEVNHRLRVIRRGGSSARR
ncbi:hypothetical protein, partial [Aeromicrobium sp.]|uniref:hypothetical protein n=1 Tax=Aeromicrobium sp. TaxID=1871063 RepID=UPI0019B6C56A